MPSPEFRLYNTMSRSVERFAPADGETVRIYSCGPTVYNPAHLGNFPDVLVRRPLRRALRMRGWQVRQVMNLTDVDDKIIRRAHEQAKTIRAGHRADHRDLPRGPKYLRIESAEVTRRRRTTSRR
jgi:cysteinyl-tRNA synthetase